MKQPYDFFLEYLTLRPQARETANISRCMQAAFRYYGYISPDNQWHEDKFLDGYTIQSLDRALREVKKDNNWQDKKSKELEKSYREMYSTVPRNEASMSKGIKGQEESKNAGESSTGAHTATVGGRLSHAEKMELIKQAVGDKIRL